MYLFKFDVGFVDLNRDTFSRSIELVTETRGTHSIEYSDIAADADTIISVAVAKTHDAAAVTLSLKNMMGCLKRVKRSRMHGIHIGTFAERGAEQMWNVLENHSWMIKIAAALVFGFVRMQRSVERRIHGGAQPGLLSHVRAISENLVSLGKVLMPDIAVIDAFEAMEGEGPGSAGTPVKMGVAVAGTDPIACDAVMAYLMGFDPLSIGFLCLAHEKGLGVADLNMIQCVGDDLSQHVHRFRPHSNYPVQMRWREAWKD